MGKSGFAPRQAGSRALNPSATGMNSQLSPLSWFKLPHLTGRQSWAGAFPGLACQGQAVLVKCPQQA